MPDEKSLAREHRENPGAFERMPGTMFYVKKKKPVDLSRDQNIKVTMGEKKALPSDSIDKAIEIRKMIDYNPGSNLKGEAAKAKEQEYRLKVASGNEAVEKNVKNRNLGKTDRELIRVKKGV